MLRAKLNIVGNSISDELVFSHWRCFEAKTHHFDLTMSTRNDSADSSNKNIVMCSAMICIHLFDILNECSPELEFQSEIELENVENRFVAHRHRINF